MTVCGIDKYYIKHYCRTIKDFSRKIQSDNFYKTEAAALAAIPERFLKEEDID